MKLTMQQVVSFILEIESKDDLKRLNDAVRNRWNRLTAYSTMQFAVGDQVTFEDKNGVTLRGVIERVNRKTCSLRIPGSRQQWRVAPDFLTKVSDNG